MKVYYTIGDRVPYLRCLVRSESTGLPLDLSGYTAKFTMLDSSGNPVIDGAAAVIEDATGGIVRYEWASGDLSAAGVFRGQFVFNEGTSGEFHVPNPLQGYINITVR